MAYDYLEEDFPGAICISVNDEIVHGRRRITFLRRGIRCRLIWIYYIRSIILMRGSRCWWAVGGVASGETDDKNGGAGALGGD